MPKLTLTPEQRQQLIEWLDGGPTDPIGIRRWLLENPNAPAAVILEQEGERDLFEFLLANDGKNVTRNQLTQKMRDSLAFVRDSLNADQAAGRPIPPHQERMRPKWDELTNL